MKRLWGWIEVIALAMLVSFGVNISGGFILATCQGTDYIKFPINAVGERLFETIMLPIVSVIGIIIIYRHASRLILRNTNGRE